MGGIPFLPSSASTVAHEFDILFAALLAISVAVLGLVVLLMLRFCTRYRRGTAVDRGHRAGKSWHWEVGWTSASLVIFLGLYAWGADLYLREHRPPAGAGDIYVVGKRWMWKVEHPGGQREINALHVAVNRPVRLVMTSQDANTSTVFARPAPARESETEIKGRGRPTRSSAGRSIG
jgi:cytochrome c oxidase subunit 2